MKLKLLPLFTAAILVATGCASSNTGAKSDKPKSAEDQQKEAQYKNQRDVNPEVGQTKEQISTLYGKPDNVSISSEGESWSYHVNRGAAYIPFNYGYRPKFRVVIFNKEGVVTHWSFTQ